MLLRAIPVLLAGVLSLSGQEAPASNPAPSPETKPEPKAYQVEPGTRIPLSMINSVSTKNAAPGERVYLETVFPILVDGRIVIPPGSYVAGTITKVQRPGKVKGRGEFFLRFDSLTLPNGVTRDFRASVSGLDGRASEELDRKEGTIKSEGNKAGDARTVGETTAAGRQYRRVGGQRGGHAAMGAGIGAAAGVDGRAGRRASEPRTGCGAGERNHGRDGSGPIREIRRKRSGFFQLRPPAKYRRRLGPAAEQERSGRHPQVAVVSCFSESSYGIYLGASGGWFCYR